MKLTKVHKVFKFDQPQWFKTDIDLNTKKKEKKLLPDMQNDFLCSFSGFGKTMEILRERERVDEN